MTAGAVAAPAVVLYEVVASIQHAYSFLIFYVMLSDISVFENNSISALYSYVYHHFC